MTRDMPAGLPETPEYTVALTDLVSRVNGFVYAGDRLDAVVAAVRELRRAPDLAAQILTDVPPRPAPPPAGERTGSVQVETGDPDYCWNPIRHMDHRHVNRDNPGRSYWCDGDGEWARLAFARWRVQDGILTSDDVDEWLRARGLPEGAGLPNLILHERGNAALATAFRMLADHNDKPGEGDGRNH